MSAYVSTHASALAAVRARGAAITFTGKSRTVSGFAIEDHDERAWRSGSTVRSELPVLFFVPSTLGDEPEENALCDWSGSIYSAGKMRRVAPDGVAIASYVEIAR